MVIIVNICQSCHKLSKFVFKKCQNVGEVMFFITLIKCLKDPGRGHRYLLKAKMTGKLSNNYCYRKKWLISDPYSWDTLCMSSSKDLLRYALRKKLRYYLGIFPIGGGGLPNSQNFCKLTKCFFACQISFISGGKTEFWEFLGGGSPIPKSKCNKNGKILTFWWKPKMFLRV